MRTLHLLPTLCLALAFCPTSLASQTDGKKPSRGAERRAAYKLLKRLAGPYSAIFNYPALPGQVAMEQAHGESKFGGRFGRLHIKMPVLGRKIEHEVTLGFDGTRREFDFTWLSSASSATVRAVGKRSKVGEIDILTFHGMMEDGMAGKRKVRHVFQFHKDGKIKFRTYDTLPTKKEVLAMSMDLVPRPAPKKGKATKKDSKK